MQNPSTATPYYAPAAQVPAPAASRPITAWSGAVVKNAAAAAAATLPVFTPDDFPPALSTKTTTASNPGPPKPIMSYASMVGRPPPTSQPSRSIASVGSAADMTSEHRRYALLPSLCRVYVFQFAHNRQRPRGSCRDAGHHDGAGRAAAAAST